MHIMVYDFKGRQWRYVLGINLFQLRDVDIDVTRTDPPILIRLFDRKLLDYSGSLRRDLKRSTVPSETTRESQTAGLRIW